MIFNPLINLTLVRFGSQYSFYPLNIKLIQTNLVKLLPFSTVKNQKFNSELLSHIFNAFSELKLLIYNSNEKNNYI
ncbi:hypothetical protein BpHYR1_047861 [Brachionus plicatilis]|uniref:Uncharacterized protein n=1 Tax=Brachionus plicatilis TaxID=10195 RepID=A0A3M7PV98_BRAPC|nr:hypothetical protein BpHYR1_047861 [Brachionus plicatilis]